MSIQESDRACSCEWNGSVALTIISRETIVVTKTAHKVNYRADGDGRVDSAAGGGGDSIVDTLLHSY